VAAYGGPALVTQPYAYCVVVVDLRRLCQSLHQNNPASVKQRADCARRGTSIALSADQNLEPAAETGADTQNGY
jgi:hypothetical protein